jgi:hypothetical protein
MSGIANLPFEKIRQPMELLCRLVAAELICEADKAEGYTDQLIASGYDVRHALCSERKFGARILWVSAGQIELRSRLALRGEDPVRIMGARMIDGVSESGQFTVQTAVPSDEGVITRNAQFVDGTSAGRLLTLGIPKMSTWQMFNE